MGRCQGGFCTPLVLDIACDETGGIAQISSPKGRSLVSAIQSHTPGTGGGNQCQSRRDAPIGHAEVLSATNDEDCTPQALERMT